MNSEALKHFRNKLSSNAPVYGLWVTLDTPIITDIAVAMGLDWVVIDAEHGHLDWKEIMEHLRGAVRSRTVILVRLAENSESLIKRTLDIGADGVVIPWIETPDQIESAIRSCQYPPKGRRGIGAERATGWGQSLAQHVEDAEKGLMVIPIIESVKGVNNIKAIIEVEGVEVIFFGPADLSATAGYPGQWEGPGVAELITDTSKIILQSGKHCGVVARDTNDLSNRLKQGFRMLAHGLDTALLINSLRKSIEATGNKAIISPSFTIHEDLNLPQKKDQQIRPPEEFRPTRRECMNPLGEGPVIELSVGVRFCSQVGDHNHAINLTTGVAIFEAGARLPYHTHSFGESITLLEGQVEVVVNGRSYRLSPLDNVSIPRGVPHSVINLSGDGRARLHVALGSSNPDRTWVEKPDTFMRMDSATTATIPDGERFTSYQNSPRYSPGPNASFLDYFNTEILPGFELSGGYGIFQSGGRLPAHVHDFDESISIVQGTAICWVEGRSYKMSDLNTALQPRGRVHYFINQSEKPMAMIWVYAGPMPERIVVDESLATEPDAAWGSDT